MAILFLSPSMRGCWMVIVWGGMWVMMVAMFLWWGGGQDVGVDQEVNGRAHIPMSLGECVLAHRCRPVVVVMGAWPSVLICQKHGEGCWMVDSDHLFGVVIVGIDSDRIVLDINGVGCEKFRCEMVAGKYGGVCRCFSSQK
jgi:hypothetical protein